MAIDQYLQNQVMFSDKFKNERKYWLNKLSNDIIIDGFPLDKRRYKESSFDKLNIINNLPENICKKVLNLSNNSNLGAFIILLAPIQFLLSLYIRNTDVVVGIPLLKSNFVSIKQNKLLIVKSTIDLDITSKEFLLQLKQTVIEANKHPNLPFNKIIESLGLKNSQESPLINTLCLLKNIHNVDSINEVEADIIFNFDIINDQIECKIEYVNELFEMETIRNLYQQYVRVLNEMLENPYSKMGDINVLDNQQRKQILECFSGTVADYPRNLTLNELFEKQVAKTPDKIAIEHNNKCITYEELNCRANKLAHVLRNKGVLHNHVVGLMLRRSIEMVVAMLGVLKSGGAYLPIDPDFPEERVKFMLGDSNAHILIMKNDMVKKIDFDGETLNIGDEINETDIINCECVNNSGDIAYIMYTSGSTGVAKGTLIRHYSISNVIYNNGFVKITDKDIMLQLSNYTFDGSCFDFYGSLLNGAKLILIDKNDVLNVSTFADVISKKGVTIFFLTTALFNLLIDTGISSLKNVKKIIFGGENASVKHVKKAVDILGKNILVNVYGPTETTTFTTCYIVDEVNDNQKTIPIGKPIANTKVYITDGGKKLLPVGAVGELCIGGDGLSLGYLNNKELTEASFIDNPFAPGEKLYKTGDIARWLPDGNIECLGRIDNQVKIRGFRIELGEVESQLLKHESINEAAVIVKVKADGDKYLCAYFTSKKDISTLKLKEFLLKFVPDYMVPSDFIKLDRIPLMPSGKINRKLLASYTRDMEPEITYEMPHKEIEKKLVDIWKEVLKVEKLGINNNFFELGGHSLKAAALISKIQIEFNVSLTIGDVFNKPTIKQLAEHIASSDKSNCSIINKVNDKEYYELSSAQKRIFLLQQSLGNQVVYNIPFVFEVEGEIDADRLEKALINLIKRQEAFRTSFEFKQGKPVQKILKHIDDFKIEYIEKNECSIDDEVKSFIRPFDISVAPLLRVKLVKTGQKKYVLMMDTHHIICDGESLNIFIKEMHDLYLGKEMPDLPIHYKDFSEWQNMMFKKEALKEQEQYWLEVFKGELPVLNMPTDYNRPVAISYEGDSIALASNTNLTDKIRDLAKRAGATVNMVLLSAYYILLSKYTFQHDIVIGLPASGRQHEGLENIIGMFVNTIAVRNYPEDNKSYKQFLEEVRSNSIQAIENQDYPFEVLVEKLGITADCSRNPLFETMFAVDNLNRTQDETDGIKIVAREYDDNSAKFDFALSVSELENSINFVFTYSTALFKRETIERLSQHYLNILKQIIETEDILLSEINILTDFEKTKLLYEFNNYGNKTPETDASDKKTIQELFEEQVKINPKHVAVSYENSSLTYWELNQKSNCIAKILRKKGVKPGNIVAVMAERSVETIVSILAVLKAGGAYMPVSPEYPISRINYMLENSGSTIILTASPNNNQESLFSREIINLDNEELYEEKENSLLNINNPDDIAYVIYTSGTTGNPKGVMVQHRNVINLVAGLSKAVYEKYDSYLNVALIAPYVFDASVQQIFASLLLGHRLCIVPNSIRTDGNKLAKYYQDNSIDISDGTPTHIKLLNNALTQRDITVKHFIIGGESLPLNTVTEFFSRVKGKLPYITNVYGLTECCVDSISYLIDPANVEKLTIIPIGLPMLNTRIYILDKNLKTVPIGVTGEVYIAGEGIGKGYLNDEKMTSEKFLPDLFVPGKMMYKTGDLARWLPDGNIEFFGRIDSQVKIRGYRIELGEIESKLLNFNISPNLELLDVNQEIQTNAKEDVTYCKKCLLDSTYPGISLDEDGICNVCKEFEFYKGNADKYFKNTNDFFKLMEKAQKIKQSKYDCLLLYSGGKDSTFVLYKLVEMGFKVLAFTFDNGYISNMAFENIKHVTSQIGVDLVTCQAKHMDEIFYESLCEDATVCTGCFKALTAISTKVALERGINVIITGLSRGQIFDTKLRDLFQQGIYDEKEIERKLLSFRKAYHQANSKINRLLNVDLYNEKDFDNIYFIDYYRYDDVTTKEIRKYLYEKDLFWNTPKDTGLCSTNCLINDLGIYTHLKVKGFHNYSAPLSWNCRLGATTPEEEMKNLKTQFSPEILNPIIERINISVNQYSESSIKEAVVMKIEDSSGDSYLCAYFVSNDRITISDLREYLKTVIPDYMIPSYFVQVDKMPLTVNGKVDTKSLPLPDRKLSAEEYDAPENEIEERLLPIYQRILCVDRLGTNSNFFALGGHSLKAANIVSEIYKEFGIELSLSSIFKNPSVKELSTIIESNGHVKIRKRSDLILLREGNQDNKNIFFVHDGSGGVEAYVNLSGYLHSSYNCWGIRAKKLEKLAPQDYSIEEIASGYFEAIREIQPHGPYLIAGWSIGGTIALETVKQIENSGENVETLILFDTKNPGKDLKQKSKQFSIQEELGFIENILPDVSINIKNKKFNTVQELYNTLSIDLENNLYTLRDINSSIISNNNQAIPDYAKTSAKEIIFYINMLRSYDRAVLNYTPNFEIETPIYFFKANASAIIKENVWNDYSKKPVKIFYLDGDHFSILKSPCVNNMANIINSIIADNTLVSAEHEEKNILMKINSVGKMEYYYRMPDCYPASSAQQRMFILWKLSPDSTVYNVPILEELDGIVDKECFKDAYKKLILRHEALRTLFKMANEEIVQEIHQSIEFNINFITAEKCDVDRIVNDFVQPFDLEKGPLIRVTLIELGENKFIFMQDIHHIVVDAISMSTIFKELTELYEGRNLPELNLQYKDYSVWQKSYEQSLYMKKQKEYWLDMFKGKIPKLHLPYDYIDDGAQGHKGNKIYFHAENILAKQIKKLVVHTESSLCMVLLTAYNVLLSKYSGQEDIIIGFPIAGRPSKDVEDIVGMFVNTIAIRNFPEQSKKLSEFLENVKENMLKAYENQYFQFDSLIDELDVQREYGKNPLFSVMFSMLNVDIPLLKASNFKSTEYKFTPNTSMFDLVLEAKEQGEFINFSLEYNTGLFKEKTMEKFANDYIKVLDLMVKNLNVKIKNVTL